MDRGVLLLLLSLNVVAVSVLYGRLSETEIGAQWKSQAERYISSLLSAKPTDANAAPACGLVPWDEYIVTSNRVVLPGGVQPAAVYISKGKITKISSDISVSGSNVLHFNDSVVSPGVIDVHAHLNEPGRTDWEGITTGTTAAAAGGITTLVDMPLNSFPTTVVASRLQEKQGLTKAKALVNIGHWAGLTPDNAADHAVLQSLLDAGALGFKSFMSPSGINDFPNVAGADIAAALPFLKRAGVPFYVHAELVSDVPEHDGLPTQYAKYLASRPVKFEQEAVQLLIQLLDEDSTAASPGFSVHIAHLSDATCLPLIKAAQEKGHPITVETCAHYLTFDADSIPDGQTIFKCAPPIRDEANRQALIAAVVDGSINLVSSDHSPAPPDLKQMDTGDFIKAWGGISGLQYLLPATWTSVKARGGDVRALSRILSTEPAKLAGLDHLKGKLQEGFDADIVVWDPEQSADTSIAGNQHRHKLSPYTNVALQGRVEATIVGGRVMSYQGAVADKPCGVDVVLRRKGTSYRIDLPSWIRTSTLTQPVSLAGSLEDIKLQSHAAAARSGCGSAAAASPVLRGCSPTHPLRWPAAHPVLQQRGTATAIDDGVDAIRAVQPSQQRHAPGRGSTGVRVRNKANQPRWPRRQFLHHRKPRRCQGL